MFYLGDNRSYISLFSWSSYIETWGTLHVLHRHFTNSCPAVAIAVAVLNASQISGTSSDLISSWFIKMCSAAVYLDEITHSRQLTATVIVSTNPFHSTHIQTVYRSFRMVRNHMDAQFIVILDYCPLKYKKWDSLIFYLFHQHDLYASSLSSDETLQWFYH